MSRLKPGAYTLADDLRQAALERHLWSKRFDQLVLDCVNAGWKHREVAEMASTLGEDVSTNMIAVRVSRARRAAREAT